MVTSSVAGAAGTPDAKLAAPEAAYSSAGKLDDAEATDPAAAGPCIVSISEQHVLQPRRSRLCWSWDKLEQKTVVDRTRWE